jgi:hypothetical protein
MRTTTFWYVAHMGGYVNQELSNGHEYFANQSYVRAHLFAASRRWRVRVASTGALIAPPALFDRFGLTVPWRILRALRALC